MARIKLEVRMKKIENNLIGKLRIYHTYEYYDEPLIYSAVDYLDHFFFVTMADWSESKTTWLYLPVSQSEIISLEKNITSIRDLLTHPLTKQFFVVEEAGDSLTYLQGSVKEVEPSWIPGPDSFVDFDYNGKTNLGAEPSEENSGSSYTIHLSLEPYNSHIQVVAASVLGEVLSKLQKLIYSLALPITAQKKSRINDDVVQANTFNVSGLYEGSFGIRLESNVIPNFFKDDPVQSNMVKAFSMFEKIKDFDSKGLDLYENKKSLQTFKETVDIFAKNNLGAKLQIIMPRADKSGAIVQRTDFVSSQARAAVKVMENADKPEENSLSLVGTLTAFDSDRLTFKFLSDATDQIYKGSISGSLSNPRFEVPSHGKIVISDHKTVNDYMDEERSQYILTSWTEETK